MAIEVAGALTRARALARAAAQWRDPSSAVRIEAREALAHSPWPAQVIEAALDNALWDLDETRALELCSAFAEESRAQERGTTSTGALKKRATTLVILPGNIIGPAIQAAFCAAVAGARAILKASSAERHLAEIVSRQFEELGVPLAGAVEQRYWPGGDAATESTTIAAVGRVIVFGEDKTIREIRGRSQGRDILAYGESYSIAFIHAGTAPDVAAAAIARDVCLFDQRGCMSPQTVYLQGDRGRAVLFAHALSRALTETSRTLPRAGFHPHERALIADAVRGLAATAYEPTPHGLDTLLRGPNRDGVPEFVVAVEPFGQPTCLGFGRIVSVKPCLNARDVVTQLKYYARPLETVGLCLGASERDHRAFRAAGASRTCAIGEMQRPPFGYRPKPSDFSFE